MTIEKPTYFQAFQLGAEVGAAYSRDLSRVILGHPPNTDSIQLLFNIILSRYN